MAMPAGISGHRRTWHRASAETAADRGGVPGPSVGRRHAPDPAVAMMKPQVEQVPPTERGGQACQQVDRVGLARYGVEPHTGQADHPPAVTALGRAEEPGGHATSAPNTVGSRSGSQDRQVMDPRSPIVCRWPQQRAVLPHRSADPVCCPIPAAVLQLLLLREPPKHMRNTLCCSEQAQPAPARDGVVEHPWVGENPMPSRHAMARALW
jgi:hypothetical protein